MYNTMYGGASQNQMNTQGQQTTNHKSTNPIHIKIEDQTGITGMN